MKALEILTKTRSQITDDHQFANMYDEAIQELESLQSVTDNIIFVWDANSRNIEDIIVNDISTSLMIDVNKNYELLLREIK